MPHRLVCVAILLVWAGAAGALVRRDVLPDWLVGPPPDLRAITRAERDDGPTTWSIQVADDPTRPDDLRAIGRVRTDAARQPDGFVRMNSLASIETAGLSRGMPLAGQGGEVLEVASTSDIDPNGNLFSFHVAVRPAGAGRHEDLLTLDGKLKENTVAVRVRCPLMPLLNVKQSFPYRARGIVQNSLGPAGRMPGLHIGQRWESQVISPLTGQVEAGKVEVVGRRNIYWDGAPVDALVVQARLSGLKARTWVRPDGLVLRQEVPTPLGHLYLERVAADKDRTGSGR